MTTLDGIMKIFERSAFYLEKVYYYYYCVTEMCVPVTARIGRRCLRCAARGYRYGHSYYRRRIENRTQAFEWHQFQ